MQVRTATREEKKKLAMAMRAKQLKSIGTVPTLPRSLSLSVLYGRFGTYFFIPTIIISILSLGTVPMLGTYRWYIFLVSCFPTYCVPGPDPVGSGS